MATEVAPTPAPGVSRPAGRLLLLVAVVGLAGILAVLLGLTAYYLKTRRPVTQLPVVEQVTSAVAPRQLFSFAEVARPVGIAVSPDGQLIYVAEGGGARLIKVFDRDGRPVRSLAPPDSKPGTRKPSSLAVDGVGRLFAVDRLRAAIDVYTPTGSWETTWQPPIVASLGGWLPNGISIGPDGKVYVTEVGQAQHRVLVFAPDGTLVNVLSQETGLPDGLKYPVQAVADEEGRIYVSDAMNGRVLAVSPQGVSSVGVVGDEAVTLPIGVAVAGQRLFVADAAAHRIAVFRVGDRPSYLHSFGDSEDDDGMAYPQAVALDGVGRLYIADRTNDRVQVWTY
ncbi:MAG: NHL repeat-containing protein [Chloroflexota bacterium]